MCHFWAEIISRWCAYKLHIDQDQREKIWYGMEVFLELLWKLIAIMVIGLIMNCTCYIQYFIRENKMNCIVNMRSNDIIWGTAYDVFSFTMLQELLANMLHIEMGWYIHFAGSMHIYDRHLKMAEKILVNQDYQSFAMPEMPQNTAKSLKEVLVAEERIRLKGHSTDNLNIEYWRDILKVLKIYSQAKRGTKIEESIVEVPKYYRDLLVLHKSIYEKL